MPEAKSRKKKPSKGVLALPDLEHAKTLTTMRERRDHAMLAVLFGCGLRRGELLALRRESLQQREPSLSVLGAQRRRTGSGYLYRVAGRSFRITGCTSASRLA